MTESKPIHPAERGMTEVLLGALAGSTLLPFFQAIATKAGEDLYAKVRSLLSGADRERAQTALDTAGSVTLADRGTMTILRLPAELPPDAAAALRLLVLPPPAEGWRIVYWDGARRMWVVDDLDVPPRNAVRIDEAPGESPSGD
ncbi:hypothetical protein Misp01_20640 [Microtetraspora sp. NBRC 13810]|uniref:hypothetical protein n=1 Tax=Microtetraspora sp. NBRC 13810 TaxID=3030990 RepID=UPI0024A18EE9|nr:hypothetical protein [Microtetraspora sp. NBRC 13810]GLW06934.1 hypothetical protein Misp01_20640 [Microtetraspora sp. NBRC 13810]